MESTSPYDLLADRWLDAHFNRADGIAQHRRALGFLEGSVPGWALLAGCGCNTRFHALLRERGLRIEGVDVSARMIELARAHRKPVLVDPKGSDYSRYRGATVLTPNRSEFREVAGRWRDEADLAARARKLRADLGLEALMVTRSEEGMSLFTETEARHEPTRAREVYDVSGAGDTVIATLSLMVAAGASLGSAMRVANHAAGIVVGKLGTAVVHRAELLESLANPS